jgi:hypothetical protein
VSVRYDRDAKTDELSCELAVLAGTADGCGHLVGWGVSPSFLSVYLNAGHCGRGERGSKKVGLVWMPCDNIEPFAEQNGGDETDTAGAATDTGGDRVYTVLTRSDGNLGSYARISSDTHDAYRARAYLRGHTCEELFDEFVAYSREQRARALVYLEELVGGSELPAAGRVPLGCRQYGLE